MDHSGHDASMHTPNPSHQHDHVHSGGGNGDHSMSMTFYWPWSSNSAAGPLLFSFLDPSASFWSYVCFCILLILACVGREWLAVIRVGVETEAVAWRARDAASSPSSSSSASSTSLSSHHPSRHHHGWEAKTTLDAGWRSIISPPALSSMLHAINMALAYLIMLVLMSFDGVFFLLIILSSGFAHFHFQNQHARSSHAMHDAFIAGSIPQPRQRGSNRLQPENDDEEEQTAFIHPNVDTGNIQSPTSSNLTHDDATIAAATYQKAARLHLAASRDCCES